jgi:hypothetical protein
MKRSLSVVALAFCQVVLTVSRISHVLQASSPYFSASRHHGYNLSRFRREIRELPYGTIVFVLLIALTIPAPLQTLAATASCPAGSTCWTGAAGDGKWETPTNWSGPISEYVDASVLLPFPGPAVITVSSAPKVSSLTLGEGVTIVCESSCKLTVESGDATLSNSGTITNSGSIQVEGGSATLSNGDTITNSGTINVVGGGAQITNSGRITNSGSINVEGGSAEIVNDGEIFNCDGGKITGEITGSAVVNACPLDQSMSTTASPSTKRTAETTSEATNYATVETGLTTITSLYTRTAQVTSTQYTYYAASTTTIVLTDTSEVRSSQAFTVPPATSELCYWYHLQYTHARGQRILGSVSSSPSTYFFVMNAGQYAAHTSGAAGRTCASYRPRALVSAISISSYNLDFVVPEDGEYHYVFYNPTKELAVVTFRLWMEEAQTATSVLSGTRTLASAYTTTQTLSSVYSTKTGEPFSVNGIPNLAIVIGVIVALILGATAAVVYRRNKKKGSESRHR